MPEVHALEPVNLRDAWPDEARDFTPWLAGQLEPLGAELGLDLDLVGQEVTLPGQGGSIFLPSRLEPVKW